MHADKLVNLKIAAENGEEILHQGSTDVVQLQAEYLNDVPGGCTWRPLHAGLRYNWVHGWRGELLLHA